MADMSTHRAVCYVYGGYGDVRRIDPVPLQWYWFALPITTLTCIYVYLTA